jgi:hypothetical protein
MKMEKAKVRSVLPTATERIMSTIVSKVRQETWGMEIEKAIKYLSHNDYPIREAIRLAFMAKWNKKNNKRLLTLPLFIHTIHYVKYNEGKLIDIHEVSYVSSSKITQKNFENIEKNKKEGNIQITLDELLQTKRMTKIGRGKLSYCLDNIYDYKKNEIIEIQTEQIL